MNRKVLALSCGVVLTLAAGRCACAETLGFDDLSGDGSAVPSGYNGFDFNNFDYINSGFASLTYGANGYTNGTVSRPVSLFNGFGTAASITSADGATFSLDNLELGAAWNNGLLVTVTGYAAGVLLDTAAFTVNETGPTLETLNFTGVDTVDFVSVGGTPATSAASGGTEFVLDNLTVNSAARPRHDVLKGILGRETWAGSRSCA